MGRSRPASAGVGRGGRGASAGVRRIGHRSPQPPSAAEYAAGWTRYFHDSARTPDPAPPPPPGSGGAAGAGAGAGSGGRGATAGRRPTARRPAPRAASAAQGAAAAAAASPPAAATEEVDRFPGLPVAGMPAGVRGRFLTFVSAQRNGRAAVGRREEVGRRLLAGLCRAELAYAGPLAALAAGVAATEEEVVGVRGGAWAETLRTRADPLRRGVAGLVEREGERRRGLRVLECRCRAEVVGWARQGALDGVRVSALVLREELARRTLRGRLRAEHGALLEEVGAARWAAVDAYRVQQRQRLERAVLRCRARACCWSAGEEPLLAGVGVGVDHPYS